ncbi:DUF2938 domain-containing protein [Paucibacter sp. XJ19-41]|uniref:DUF2938 domain-containing protein n=1 Tax=Paucibacter sp. XJ19-41 TaxID=2927824 RepID=UPI00234B531D|nr:DUF2938 domain-containing protein [Paucibacter sp. XJ19-41]MDC6170385.1 DUF2938 domain-containing protein [Paucibacter sp. XJ19-41]
MTSLQDISRVALIGVGATLVMDGWLWLLRRLGVPTLNFALIGRWVGHLPRGRLRHAPISAAAAVPGELALGWLLHYGTGIVFAALLVGVQGLGWAQQPTLAPALVWGAATVLAPLFVMQPAMGAGIASSKTPTPLKNCLRSLANHLVFGLGLYLSAAVLSRL